MGIVGGFIETAEEGSGGGVVAQPHRVLLFELIKSALKAERGVRMRRAQRVNTEYYAGRRSEAIYSAAQLLAVLYGMDFAEAKQNFIQAVRTAGEAVDSIEELVEPLTADALARTIAENVLSQTR